jgi:hypothetical protein
MRLRRSTASPSLMASLLAPPLVLVLVLVLGPDGVCAAEESLLRLLSRHAPGQAGMEEPLDQVAVLIATERGAVQLGDTDPMKNTPLHLAAARGYSRVVSALLAAGASVEASNAQMETALCVASRAELPGGGSPGLATVTALVEGGANVNHQPHGGYSPLHHCARGGRADVCAVLLQKGGADANAKTSQGQTALHLAARAGDESVARLLVGHGARVNEPNNFGLSPLQTATGAVAQLLRRPPSNASSTVSAVIPSGDGGGGGSGHDDDDEPDGDGGGEIPAVPAAQDAKEQVQQQKGQPPLGGIEVAAETAATAPAPPDAGSRDEVRAETTTGTQPLRSAGQEL